ncbi:SpaA isopeptide-forming pilin-related protein [Roseburia hominis]
MKKRNALRRGAALLVCIVMLVTLILPGIRVQASDEITSMETAVESVVELQTEQVSDQAAPDSEEENIDGKEVGKENEVKEMAEPSGEPVPMDSPMVETRTTGENSQEQQAEDSENGNMPVEEEIADSVNEFGEDYFAGSYSIENFQVDQLQNTPGKRLEVAKRHSWEKYLDQNNYLRQVFYTLYSDKQLTYLTQKDHEIVFLHNPEPFTISSSGRALATTRAASGKVTQMTKTTTLGYTTAVFKITDPVTGYNGEAFCSQHSKYTPEVGTALTNGGLVTNQNIRKCVYYWYTGDIKKQGSTYTFGYTSLAISYFNGDTFQTNQTFRDFMDWIKGKPNAPADFKVYWANTTSSSYQNLVYGKMEQQVQKGKVTLKKSSANPALTNNNSYYSLNGAVFEVYSDKNCTKKVGTLTTNANGTTNTIELNAGTYYVKETKAPKGFALSKEVKSVTITSGKTATVSFTDLPQADPVGVLLGKIDAETNQNKPQGSATLAGAEFTILYYDSNPDSGAQPKKRWVFKTDEDGFCYYADEYLIDGDSLYYATNGYESIPLGYITIQETKAPEGYLINQELFICEITSNGTAELVYTYNQPIIPENILRLDLVKKQEGTDIVIPDVEFEHTKPDGTKENVKTDQNGQLTLKGLQYGEHTLKETAVMDGYELNENVISFTVAEDNSITLNSSFDESQGKVEFTVTEEGNISIEMEDKLSPFELVLHKINNRQLKLDGAEFTVYSDKECTQQVAKGVTENGGELHIDDLEVGTKYYLKETKAPKGYRIQTDLFGNPVVWEFYTESIPAEDKFIFYVDDKAYDSSSEPNEKFTVSGTKEAREVHMTIENSILRRLPNTGSPWTIIVLLGGIMCFAYALILSKKEKGTMKNNVMKKMCAVALVSAMAVTALPGNVWAADGTSAVASTRAVALTAKGEADFGRGNANITIQGNEGQTLIGKKFNVYKLFAAENSVGGESINYTINAPYKTALKTVVGKKLSKTPSDVTEYEVIDYIQSLNTNPVEGAQATQKNEGSYSDFRYFIEELRNEIVKEGVTGDVVTVTSVKSNNSVVIKGLEYGYYIIDEVSNVSGSHSAASLCMVNTLNPSAEVDIKSDYPSVTKKIQEDDDRNSIGSDGWNDMADFEIGQTVPYKFTSNVPDMNGYDTYYYAWHDVMDEALTFQPNSVGIVIKDKNGKTYTLKKSEFSINTNPGNGETFKVEVRDLKAIVDREFDQINSNSENIYGQEVVLRYDAVLNDKAAEDTGRPGFENDVKLEFSNNPDGDGQGETGETPWDTVVCFTYKLNGLKTNNHDLVLEGAKFRLYSDENCRNEVYVKKTANGYNVINRDSVGGNDHTGGSIHPEAVEMVSAKDGVFTIFGLDGGVYWLKETEAPDGYRLIEDPIRLEVNPTFVQDRNSYVKGQGATDQALAELEYEAYIKQFLSGVMKDDTIILETDIEEGSGNLTVVNQVGMKLPITGSNMTIICLGAGIVLIFLALRKKEKTVGYEK